MNWRDKLPIIESLSDYYKTYLRRDLIAGLTVGVMLVPQAMAYALLAGMPPIYGLYAGIFPLILYAILGTSRQLSIGPVAVSAILVLGGISQLAEPMSPEYISLVLLTGLLIGILQVILSLFRLGFLVNFLSHPVIAGFTSGAAVVIAVSQLKYLLGIEIPRFKELHETVIYAIQHIQEINPIALTFGLGGIILMLLIKRINKRFPAALTVVILGIILVSVLGLVNQGVSVVGEIPKGLPEFYLPELTVENILAVLPTVITVTLIGIVESVGIAKALETKHDYYRIRPDQELLALGVSKIGGAFFQALPTSGSFTRSAINNQSGARTGVSSLVTAVLMTLTLLFLTPLFYYLPEAILAAVVILAVRSLFEFEEAKHLWKVHRTDFWMMLTTFLVTIGIGIKEGVFAGVVLSVLAMTYESVKPHIAILGRLPNTTIFRNIKRFPEAMQHDEILIVRFDAQLYFTNADYFRDTLIRLVKAEGPELRLFVLDASSILEMDSTGLQALREFLRFLQERQVEFYISGVIGPVRDIMFKANLSNDIGEENQFMNPNDAVEAYLTRHDDSVNIWKSGAIQTNHKK